MNGIQIQNLTKNFGQTRALDNVNLTFEEGKIYGLLGRNGAGKSTLLGCITNRLFPDAGQVLINGLPAMENDTATGLVYMMSEKSLYPEGMRVRDVFRWAKTCYGGAFDMEYAVMLCDMFGLDPKKKTKQLSTGYASIFKIITALALKVPYLMLDEPVLGLDANHRELFYRELLENYASYPRTIVLSTHLIEEVSSLIEEVVIIKEGHIIVTQSSESLLREGYAISGPAAMVDAFAAGKQVIGENALGGLKTVYIRGERDAQELPAGLEISAMDLQKLFIQLTNA